MSTDWRVELNVIRSRLDQLAIDYPDMQGIIAPADGDEPATYLSKGDARGQQALGAMAVEAHRHLIAAGVKLPAPEQEAGVGVMEWAFEMTTNPVVAAEWEDADIGPSNSPEYAIMADHPARRLALAIERLLASEPSSDGNMHGAAGAEHITVCVPNVISACLQDLERFGKRCEAAAERIDHRTYEVPPELLSAGGRQLRQWVDSNVPMLSPKQRAKFESAAKQRGFSVESTPLPKLNDDQLRDRLAEWMGRMLANEHERVRGLVADQVENLIMNEFRPLAGKIVKALGSWQLLSDKIPAAPKAKPYKCDRDDNLVCSVCGVQDGDTRRAGCRILLWGAMADEPRAYSRELNYGKQLAAWARAKLVIPLIDADGYRMLCQPFVTSGSDVHLVGRWPFLSLGEPIQADGWVAEAIKAVSCKQCFAVLSPESLRGLCEHCEALTVKRDEGRPHERGSLLEVRTELESNHRPCVEELSHWRKMRHEARRLGWPFQEDDAKLLKQILDWLAAKHGKSDSHSFFMQREEIAGLMSKEQPSATMPPSSMPSAAMTPAREMNDGEGVSLTSPAGEYDHLRIKLLDASTDGILRLPSWDRDEKHNDEELARMVTKLTSLSLERWDKLCRSARLPWMREASRRLDAEAAKEDGAKRRNKRGRRVETDVAGDRRLWEAWQTGRYKRYAELAQEVNLTPGEIERAIERHRKRERRLND